MTAGSIAELEGTEHESATEPEADERERHYAAAEEKTAWIKELTEEEHGALLEYKSSGSYKINAAIREEAINGTALSEEQKRTIAKLDAALKKAPKYQGEVYRNITFDDFGGEEELNAFLAGIEEGKIKNFSAYTSASTKADGYPVKGKYTVSFIINGSSARDVDGIGNNSESEVIFERDSKFFVDKIIYDENGKPIIYMEEATQNGTGQFPNYDDRPAMQQLQTLSDKQGRKNGNDNVQGISERNTARNLREQEEMQILGTERGAAEQEARGKITPRAETDTGLYTENEAYKKAKLSSADARKINALGKLTGVQIRFAEANDPAFNGDDVNAAYDDENKRITISIDAENPFVTATIHETVHRLKEIAPEAYNELKFVVFKSVSEDSILQAMDKRFEAYAEEIAGMSEKEALDYISEETTADAVLSPSHKNRHKKGRKNGKERKYSPDI